jgi:hypothetical protein
LRRKAKLLSSRQSLPHFGAVQSGAVAGGDDHEAEDLVQEAYMRAFKFFGGYRGGTVGHGY